MLVSAARQLIFSLFLLAITLDKSKTFQNLPKFPKKFFQKAGFPPHQWVRGDRRGDRCGVSLCSFCALANWLPRSVKIAREPIFTDLDKKILVYRGLWAIAQAEKTCFLIDFSILNVKILVAGGEKKPGFSARVGKRNWVYSSRFWLGGKDFDRNPVSEFCQNLFKSKPIKSLRSRQ